ncbi:MAG: endonuclease/exonuclease/phosphatase family protein [Clostridia bacterium]|nr:endonuclease/exonuclease/phosphatase family protein [Clostridia bacterium]
MNLLVHYSSWGGTSVNERKDIFFDLVNGYAPDVIGLQEMCNDWYGEIKRNVNSYEFASPLTTAFPQKMTAILYNKNSVELIDSGSIAFSNSVNFKSRRVAWALFKSKTTGEVFCVVNTHLSYLTEAKKEENFFTQTRQVNELYSITEKLYSQYNSPVIIIGDFNTKKRGSYDKSVILAGSYGILNSLYTDAEDIAQNKYNGENLGYKNTLNDHIFIKGYIKIKNLSILSQEAFSSLSDHYPLMADIILKNNP